MIKKYLSIAVFTILASFLFIMTAQADVSVTTDLSDDPEVEIFIEKLQINTPEKNWSIKKYKFVRERYFYLAEPVFDEGDELTEIVKGYYYSSNTDMFEVVISENVIVNSDYYEDTYVRFIVKQVHKTEPDSKWLLKKTLYPDDTYWFDAVRFFDVEEEIPDVFKGYHYPPLAKVIIGRASGDDGETETDTEEITLFTDVLNPEASYYNAVYWAVEQGIASGSETVFGVNDSCTRGEILVYLWKAAGMPSASNPKNIFKDVSEGSEYYDAIVWACSEGIAKGYNDGTFRPNNTCTRGQFVTFLWRMRGSRKPQSSSVKFRDVTKSNPYYKAILWATEEGLTKGFTDGTFRSGQKCSKGQCMTFLYRLFG